MFYFPYILLSTFLLFMSFFAFPLLSLSVFLVCLLLSCCLLSFFSTSNFLCLPSNFSFRFYLFLCVLLSFFAFFYFHSLSVFCSIHLTPYSSFYPFVHLCVCFLLLLLSLLFLLSFLSSCFFFLFFLPIF